MDKKVLLLGGNGYVVNRRWDIEDRIYLKVQSL